MKEYLINKLINIYDTHGNIVVGVDFDDTIFSSVEATEKICDRTVEVLIEAQPYIVVCLYSVADKQSLRYKEEIMKCMGIEPEYINKSPLDIEGISKPFFNLLLDDKAGLSEALDVLEGFSAIITKR